MITAKEFFNKWKDTVTKRQKILENNWRNDAFITNEIINNDNSVIEEIAKKLGLLS